MKRAESGGGGSQLSEMAIVDTFTKLIFGEDTHYNNAELMIIQAFRMVDTNVLFDSHRDMGAYLQALSVGEMIDLVSRVQRQLVGGSPPPAETKAARDQHSDTLNRRVH